VNYTDNFNKILNQFNIKANCVDYHSGNNYFYYDLFLSPKTKVKDIAKYSDEISLSIKSYKKPSIKLLYDKGLVRLEFASSFNRKLCLFDYFTNVDVPKGDLVCLLGESVDGTRMWLDLSKNPHMLIAGTTGSGKSTLLHNIIANLFNYSNFDKLFLLDPKNIEFINYEGIRNNVSVKYTYDDSLLVLDYLTEVMENRYNKIRSGFNLNEFEYIVLIIDEFSDLILQDKYNMFYNKLCKLSQKCRAAKISIILSTQRPSANIINGTIKANFPARISCRVMSYIDSKVILDNVGAENLIGYGDSLISDNFRHMERFQTAYTDSKEVCKYFHE
jgi:S-DNA-T family DNA segregation ATPase FtsK/SpoIIIE